MISKSIIAICTLTLAACNYHTTATGVKTDYRPGGVYNLQRDVYLWNDGDTLFPSIDNPRYFLYSSAENQTVAMIPKGGRIQFKKIVCEHRALVGTRFHPVGVLLDPPHTGTPVMVHYISQNEDAADPSIGGRFVNPSFLRLERNLPKASPKSE